MWSALPNGVVIVVTLVVTAVMTGRQLPFIPVLGYEHMVPRAIAFFGDFAAGRIALIAVFLLTAGLAFALLARAVRRGAPAAPLIAGLLTAAYLTGLLLVFDANPITDYRYQWLPIGPGLGLAGMPFDPEMATPDRYLPTLAGLLVIAGVAQGVAMVLVARSVPSVAGRRSAPLKAAPAFAVAYAAINLVVAQIAWNETGVDYVAGQARIATLVNTAFMAVPALVLALRARASALYGFMTVIYLLTLLEAWYFNPLGTRVLSNDDSGFSDVLLSWQPHAITAVVVAAALTQLAGVVSLMRRAAPRTRPEAAQPA
jgi:hypothetical protein